MCDKTTFYHVVFEEDLRLSKDFILGLGILLLGEIENVKGQLDQPDLTMDERLRLAQTYRDALAFYERVRRQHGILER